MTYFTNFQDYLFLCSDLSSEEKQRLDNYLRILEHSGISRTIAETVTKSIEAIHLFQIFWNPSTHKRQHWRKCY